LIIFGPRPAPAGMTATCPPRGAPDASAAHLRRRLAAGRIAPLDQINFLWTSLQEPRLLALPGSNFRDKISQNPSF